jgi:succinate dehydrogenase / fumarate reductase flavoprotein subunit
MERYAPSAKDLASRDVVSRSMTIEIREGRGVGKNKDHIYLHLDHLDPKILHERLPGISESAQDLRRRRCDPRADPGAADRALQHGRHPDELSRRSRDQEERRRRHVVVPGLMAIGEAACVSVHGANRLGSNSLIDLVVFGRAAACAAPRSSTPNASQPTCRKRIRRKLRSDRSTISATPRAARRPRSCARTCRR